MQHLFIKNMKLNKIETAAQFMPQFRKFLIFGVQKNFYDIYIIVKIGEFCENSKY